MNESRRQDINARAAAIRFVKAQQKRARKAEKARKAMVGPIPDSTRKEPNPS